MRTAVATRTAGTGANVNADCGSARTVPAPMVGATRTWTVPVNGMRHRMSVVDPRSTKSKQVLPVMWLGKSGLLEISMECESSGDAGVHDTRSDGPSCTTVTLAGAAWADAAPSASAARHDTIVR